MTDQNARGIRFFAAIDAFSGMRKQRAYAGIGTSQAIRIARSLEIPIVNMGSLMWRWAGAADIIDYMARAGAQEHA